MVMKTKYKIKITKPLIAKLKPFWAQLDELEDEFSGKVMKLETKMQKATKIKDIEFYMVDGDYVGIGNVNRTMPLIHRHEVRDE